MKRWSGQGEPGFRWSKNALVRGVTLLSAAAFTVSVSGPSLAAPGWSASGTITEIVATENAINAIVTGVASPVGCSSTTWFRLSAGAANYQAISAVIMTARAQNRPIKFWVNQCDSDGASLVVAAWSS